MSVNPWKFIGFFDEYWARVYDGALGYTLTSMTGMLQENQSSSKLRLDQMFFNPRSEELQLLWRMRWENRPLVY